MGFKFDYSIMDKLQTKNLWFIEILQDKELKEFLFSSILTNEHVMDSDNRSQILKVMKLTAEKHN